MAQLANEGFILSFDEEAMDHSSFDLHLSDEVYEVAEGVGAIKPNGIAYFHVIKPFVSRLAAESGTPPQTFVLRPRRTYVVRLKERLVNLQRSSIYGQATAKSSVGRVDVLARLVVDGMVGYEGFIPHDLGRGTGDMFLEITSMTFPVRIKENIKLSQLRLFYGPPEVSEIKGGELLRTVLRAPSGGCELPKDPSAPCFLSVNLENDNVGGLPAAAFNAADVGEEAEPINLWKGDGPKPDPCKSWKVLAANPEQKRLPLITNQFYILRSREKLALTDGVAAYCRAIDETIGEMRIHYAGFVHPFFGRDRKDGKVGTPLIFEVRGHDVPISLADGEVMARLTFYRMSIDAEKEKGKRASSYEDQELKLSDFFGNWPSKLKADKDGNVRQVEES